MKWNEVSCSWIQRFHIFKVLALAFLTYMFKTSCSKRQKIHNSNSVLKENQTWWSVLDKFNTAALKWQSYTGERIDRSLKPNRHTHKHSQLNFDKSINVTQWRKDSLFKNGAEKKNGHLCEKKSLDTDLSTFMRIKN